MENLKKEFREMLLTVGKNFSEDLLTAQFPIVGDQYKRELMVVGRALNGWGTKKDKIWWNPTDGNPSEEIIGNIINYSFEEKSVCPMKWIIDHWGWETEVNKMTPEKEQYNMKKKAFWRVIKKILMELGITTDGKNDADWSSYLVWSNLYKVAPPEGGNPSNKLCDAQLEQGKLLLKDEIAFFKPKRILFLTGYDWFRYFEDIGFEGKKRLASMVEWVGSYNKTKVIVAKRPEMKNETEYVKQVIKYFQQ